MSLRKVLIFPNSTFILHGVAGGMTKTKVGLVYNLVLLTGIPMECMTCTATPFFPSDPRTKIGLVFLYIYTVSRKTWPLKTFVNNNSESKPVAKYFTHKISKNIAELILHFCSNNFSFSFTAKLTFLLSVPVSSIFHCRRFTVSCEWPMFIGECCKQLFIPYCFSCSHIIVNTLSSFDNILQILCVFLFSVNKLWHHVDVIVNLPVRNLGDGLNFWFWLPA